MIALGTTGRVGSALPRITSRVRSNSFRAIGGPFQYSPLSRFGGGCGGAVSDWTTNQYASRNVSGHGGKRHVAVLRGLRSGAYRRICDAIRNGLSKISNGAGTTDQTSGAYTRRAGGSGDSDVL